MNINYKVTFTKEAIKDLDESYNYYFAENEKIAQRFIESLDNSIDLLKFNPQINRIIYKNVRRCLTSNFPFQIYYRIINNYEINIIAIFHSKRAPKVWKKR